MVKSVSEWDLYVIKSLKTVDDVIDYLDASLEYADLNQFLTALELCKLSAGWPHKT